MNAPNRREWIKQIWNDSPPPGLFLNDDIRRVYLLGTLLPELNKKEKLGEWGFLIKTEREPDFIPSDVIVWKDTGEHFDVLIGTKESGPTWIAHGPIRSSWKFGSISNGTTPPPPPPPNGELEAKVAALQTEVANLKLVVEQNRVRMEAINTRFDGESANLNVHKTDKFAGRAPIFGGNVTSSFVPRT